jgi:hypothetical protein
MASSPGRRAPEGMKTLLIIIVVAVLVYLAYQFLVRGRRS